MKKISIQKSGVITNQVEREAVQADAWLEEHIGAGTFGAAAYSYESEVTPAVYESQEILDEGDVSFDPPQFHNVLITPAIMETINVPAEYEVIEEDTTAAVALEELKASKIALGRAARQTCESVLDLIGGFNIGRELTFGQKNTMKATFADAKSALNDYQPSYAKYFIGLIEPDEVLVTTEMKDLCLDLLAIW